VEKKRARGETLQETSSRGRRIKGESRFLHVKKVRKGVAKGGLVFEKGQKTIGGVKIRPRKIFSLSSKRPYKEREKGR